MRQILFEIPIPDWLRSILANLFGLVGGNFTVTEIPIYVYGLMLFLAFIFCSALSKRLCKYEGINPELMPDLIIWLFISGIAGGRLVFVIQYWEPLFANGPLWRTVALWDGGLVLYGALFGGGIGYFAYHRFAMGIMSHWKMPRRDHNRALPCESCAQEHIGCLFTGCCFGNVACDAGPAIHFPLLSNTTPADFTAPVKKMISLGYQAPLGFQWDDRSWRVDAVEPGSAAANAGLRDGDIIHSAVLLVGDQEIPLVPLDKALRTRGMLKLTVGRDGEIVSLPPFEPRSIGLHPTQVYETISMALLLFFLLSYHRFKRHDGELMVLFMFCYGVHRFLNEMLRTDTDPVAFGLTLSQNVSILVLASARCWRISSGIGRRSAHRRSL